MKSGSLLQGKRSFYTTLVTMCFLQFSVQFAYDIVALDAPRCDIHLTPAMLNAAVFLPGIVMAFAAGLVVDRYGFKVSGLLATALALLGSVIAFHYARDCSANGAFGRLVFGFGMEPATVVALTALQLVTNPKRIGIVFAVFASCARLGSLLADSVPRWMGVVQTHLSVANVYVDSDAYRLYWTLAVCFLSLALILMMYLCYTTPAHDHAFVSGSISKPIWRFPKQYWILVLICATTYASVFTARTFGFTFLKDLGMSDSDASSKIALTSAIPLFCCIPFGWLADHVRSELFITGALCLVTGFGLLLFEHPLGYVPIGLGYAALSVAIWPSIKDWVKVNSRGSANGLITSVQNAAIAVMLVSNGFIHDRFNSDQNALMKYRVASALLFATTFVCLIGTIAYVALSRSAHFKEAEH